MGDHKSSLKNATETGNRAVSVAKGLKTALSKSKTVVHGDGDIIFGKLVKPPLFRGKSGKMIPRLSAGQIKTVANRVEKAGKDLLSFASKYGSRIKATEAKHDAAKKSMTPTRSAKVMSVPKPTAVPLSRGQAYTKVHGDEGEHAELQQVDEDIIYGAHYGAMAEALDKHIDDLDIMILGQAVADQATDATADAAVSDIPDAYKDPTADMPPPTRESVLAEWKSAGNYTPDPHPDGIDETTYTTAMFPNGGIIFDGSKNLQASGEASIGSLNRFYNFKKDSGRNGFQLNNDGWQTYDPDPGFMRSKYSKPYGSETGPTNNLLNKTSVENHWGPIIGRPKSDPEAGGVSEWQGLRVLIDDKTGEWNGTLFWFFDTAPEWAKAKQIELLMNQAMADYKTQLAAAKAESAEKILADQLEAQAADEEQKRLAKEAADDSRRQEKEQKEAEHQAALKTTAEEQAQRTKEAADTAAAAQEETRARAEEERGGREAEAQATYEEKAAAGEEERQAAREARQADIDERMAQRAEEAASRREEHELDLAQRLDQARADALTPPSGGEAPEEGGDEGGGIPSMDVDSEGLSQDMSVEEMLGVILAPQRIRGVDRIRARRDERR
jgi:hypothetical protein